MGQAGASLTITDRAGRTAAEWARAAGKTAAALYLERMAGYEAEMQARSRPICVLVRARVCARARERVFVRVRTCCASLSYMVCVRTCVRARVCARVRARTCCGGDVPGADGRMRPGCRRAPGPSRVCVCVCARARVLGWRDGVREWAGRRKRDGDMARACVLAGGESAARRLFM